jgi:hypothetical protein
MLGAELVQVQLPGEQVSTPWATIFTTCTNRKPGGAGIPDLIPRPAAFPAGTRSKRRGVFLLRPAFVPLADSSLDQGADAGGEPPWESKLTHGAARLHADARSLLARTRAVPVAA